MLLFIEQQFVEQLVVVKLFLLVEQQFVVVEFVLGVVVNEFLAIEQFVERLRLRLCHLLLGRICNGLGTTRRSLQRRLNSRPAIWQWCSWSDVCRSLLRLFVEQQFVAKLRKPVKFVERLR